MTTVSYPAVGDDGFNEVQWATYFDAEDGIVNDYTGGSLALSRINTGDIARYSPGKVRVAGYILDVTANHDLTVPTAAATYYTWACYDPALNVADGSGDADPLGPVRLGISTGDPSPSGGKQYFRLDKIVRAASQVLSSATVSSWRRWIGPHLFIALGMPSNELTNPEVPTLGWGPYPLGTTVYSASDSKTYHRAIRSPGVLMWQDSAGTPVALPLASGMAAFDIAPEYVVSNGRCFLQGTVKRSNGNNLLNASSSTDVTIATLPVGIRPEHIRRMDGYGGAGARAQVKVQNGGDILLTANVGENLSWVDLSGVNFLIGP